MAASLKNDFTVGNVVRQLAAFSVPTFFANALQAMYGLADMIIVGQFVGEAGLSAIGLCSEIIVVLSAASTGLCTGGTVVLSQYVGRHDDNNQKSAIVTLFALMLATAIVLSILGLVITPYIVHAVQTPPEAVNQAIKYMYYSCGGIVFIFGYNMVCAVLRGIGNSKIPMYVIGFASVSNVVLDFIFVGIWRMDAGGAALATVIAQGTACFLSLFFLCKNGEIPLNTFLLKPERDKAILILRVGIPNMLQVTLVHISLIFVGAMISIYGVTASAASGIGQKMTSISILVRQSIGAGVSAMTGQNMAVGKFDRVEKTVKAGVVFSFSASMLLSLTLWVFPEGVAGIFTKDADVIHETVKYLRIIAISYIFMSPMTVFNSLAIGAGNARQSMVNSMLDAIVCRIPLCLIMDYCFGLSGLYIATAISPLSATISGAYYFIKKKWQNDYLIKP